MKMTGAAMAVAMGWWSLMSTADAVPPTVTPSPGYDARLKEEREARVPSSTRPLAGSPHQPGRPRHPRVHR